MTARALLALAFAVAAVAGCSSTADHGPGTGGASGAPAATGGPGGAGGAAGFSGMGGSMAGGMAGATGGAAEMVATGGSGGVAGGRATAGAAGFSATVGAAGRGGIGGGGAAGRGAAGNGGGGTSSNANTVDVYLIGGQSNATGQGYSKNLPAGFTIDTKVQIYHSSSIVSGGAANAWISLRAASEGTDSCNLGLRFGPELGFGNAIQSDYPTRAIYIIKHAVSNTGLAGDWAPGSSAGDSAHFGPQFQTFVTTVNGGLKALEDKGLHPLIRGMLWQQGERDVDMGGTAASSYGKNLAAFIARVREQWSAPDMLFVYGYIYPASNYGTARDQVRQGQADVDGDSGSPLAVKGAFVVTDDNLSLRANDPNTCLPNDKIHFGTQGQLDLGTLMATKVHDKLPLP